MATGTSHKSGSKRMAPPPQIFQPSIENQQMSGQPSEIGTRDLGSKRAYEASESNQALQPSY